MPRTSVVVPNFNHARYLEQRVQSILDQTDQDFELLLLDDASTDQSIEILKQFADHPKVRTIERNSKNTGNPFAQWNKGVSLAKGDLIWIAESDDFANNQLLEKLTGILEANPAVGVAYCQSLAVDENSQPLHLLQKWTEDLDANRWAVDYINAGPEECRNYLTLKCTIPNASAAVFRRSVYERVGGADERFRLAGDWMLWTKLLLESDVAFVAEPLNFFRTHRNTVRKASSRSAIALQEAFLIFNYIQDRIEVPTQVRSRVLDSLLDRWICELSKGRFELSTNSSIYRSLRTLDPALHKRILRRAGRSVSRRLSRTATPTCQNRG